MREAQTGDPRQSPVEVLNATQAPREGGDVRTVIHARADREKVRHDSATPPGRCELCVPNIRIVEDSYFLTITEAAHEARCPNYPSEHTQLLKESTTW